MLTAQEGPWGSLGQTPKPFGPPFLWDYTCKYSLSVQYVLYLYKFTLC